VADAVTKLKADLRAKTPLREKTNVPLAALASTFPFPASSQGKISYDQTTHVLTFVGRMTAAQRDDLLAVPVIHDPTRAAGIQLFTPSQDSDCSRIDQLDVRGCITYFQQNANPAATT